MRHRTAITAATGTLLALAPLTACAGGAAPSEAAAPRGEASAAAAPGASASASASARTRFALGEVGEVTDLGGRFTVVALDYTQPAEGPQPPDRASLGGDVWATVEVKVCNTASKTFTVSQFPWSLAYEDGTRVKVTGLNGGDLPKPEFPTVDEAVKQGDCVRGKIPFPVQGDKRPARVQYAPESLDEPFDWVVPAAPGAAAAGS